jgi:hypothetical protein
MYRAIVLGAVGLLAMVAAAGCASVPSTLPVTSEGVTSDAVAYAEDMGISLDEAVRRLALQPAAGELQAALIERESGVFGGLWIEHEPKFRVVVAVTRDERRVSRRYVAGSVLENVVVMQRVEATLGELEALQHEVMGQLAELGSHPDSGIHVQQNCVELYVADLEVFEARLLGAEVTLPEHVCVTQVGPYAAAPPLAPPEGLTFPRQDPPEGMLVEMAALLIGRLVEVEGCLRVVGDEDPGQLVIWPYDHTVALGADGTIVVRDGEGVTVARVGDLVRVGGGQTPGLASPTVAESVGDCEGPFWIAARGIEGDSIEAQPDDPDAPPL